MNAREFTPDPGTESPYARNVRRLRSPIAWFGGKGILAPKIVSLFPSHDCYVEPFCGGASCLFAKSPSPVEVINDLDSDIVNFFRVLRDSRKFGQFYKLASLTPYSRQEFLRYRAEWRSRWPDCDDVERAYRWFVVARMSFAGELGRGWGFSVGTSRRGMANGVAQWLSSIDMLPTIAERVKRVQIEHGDWGSILERYDSPDTLFYADPPFVLGTRRSGGYVHEMDDADHAALVDGLQRARGKVLLSGYRNETYARLESMGWDRVDMRTVCYAAGRTRRAGLQGRGSLAKHGLKHVRTESLWISPRARKAAGGAGLDYVQSTFSF